MKNVWQLQEAKDQLSMVVQNALTQGAQTITRHGKPAVLVISLEEFRRARKPSQSLSKFFAESPLKALDLDLERVKEYPRDLKL